MSEHMICLPSRKPIEESLNKELSAKVITKLESEYIKHLSAFPGPYRHQEACDSKHNDSYRAWVQKKLDLQGRMEVYSKMNIPIHGISNYVDIQPPKRITRIDRKSVDLYYKCYLQSIEYMQQLNQDTIEWAREKARARNLRIRLIKRAESEGVAVPNPLPLLPEYKKNE